MNSSRDLRGNFVPEIPILVLAFYRFPTFSSAVRAREYANQSMTLLSTT